MYTIIKILVLTFISIFTYDTINFISQKSVKPQTELDVRKKLQPEIKIEMPPPEEYDDDCIPGLIVFFWIAFIATYVFSRFRKSKKISAMPSIECQPSNEEEMGIDDVIMTSLAYDREDILHPSLATVSEFIIVQPNEHFRNENTIDYQVELEQSKPDIPELSFRVDSTELETSKLMETLDSCASNIFDYTCSNPKEEEKVSLSDNGKQNIVIIDSYKNEYAGLVEISHSASTQSTISNANLINEANPYQPVLSEMKDLENSCQCNIDKFEERLEAVESNLKSTETVTKQWGKRIEQAEQELINLHRQMYTILSKAQFRPPSGDTINNLGQDKEISFKQFTSEITDVTKNITPSTVDPYSTVPNIIAEAKKQLEEEELFKKSWNSAGDNKKNITWPAEKEEVVELPESMDKVKDTFDWKDNLKTDVSKQIEAVKRQIESPTQSNSCITTRKKNVGKPKKSVKFLDTQISETGVLNPTCIESKMKRELLIKQEELREKTNSLVQEIEAVVKRESNTNNTVLPPPPNLTKVGNNSSNSQLQVKVKGNQRVHITGPSKRTMFTESDRISRLSKPAQPVNKSKIKQ
ncbi:uncharacterized protein LOC106664407 isoform X2 [Cimex lectularius]|uniref:Uncharacterized protein n=1 Tax=Cimex lectularius TaxID=79782 RepID=A0A8I6RHK0_CIMLE|nr:uncharacterized protein LOC106664407 isoform X2 [Cimex lectularius]